MNQGGVFMPNINSIDMLIEGSLQRINDDDCQYRDMLVNDWKKTIGDVLDFLQGYDGEIRELIDYIRIFVITL